jgi:hypothetical protein
VEFAKAHFHANWQKLLPQSGPNVKQTSFLATNKKIRFAHRRLNGAGV